MKQSYVIGQVRFSWHLSSSREVARAVRSHNQITTIERRGTGGLPEERGLGGHTRGSPGAIGAPSSRVSHTGNPSFSSISSILREGRVIMW